MWAGGAPSGPFSGPWPINQSMYQNIPHDKIDWAALAQQWIQMRETTRRIGELPHPPCVGPERPPMPHGPPCRMRLPGSQMIPAMPPRPPPPPMPRDLPLLGSVRPVGSDMMLHGNNSGPQDSYVPPNDWSSFWNPTWNSNAPSWAPPHAPENKDSIQTFDYGHMHGNQGYAAQTYEYNHGTDQIGLNQTVAPEPSQFNDYWSAGNGSSGPPPPPPPSLPLFLRSSHDDLVDRSCQPLSKAEIAAPTLDAAKRKNLPGWIREGLEKMEREKQKKLEREEMSKERELRLQAERESEEKALREFHALKEKEKDLEDVAPRRSKFESDSEEGSSVDSDSDDSRNRRKASPPPQRQQSLSPFEAAKTEQERMEELMVKVRRMLTEILLDVTTDEITSIAKEVFIKARARAPALQLAKSSALASITGGLGFEGYSSDGDMSGDDDDNSDNDVDSDAELQESIHRRQLEFAQRERDMESSVHGSDTLGDDTADAVDRGRTGEATYVGAGFAEKSQVASSPNGCREQSEFAKRWYEEDIPGLGMMESPVEVKNVKEREEAVASQNMGRDREEEEDDDDSLSSSISRSARDRHGDARESQSGGGKERQQSQSREQRSGSVKRHRDSNHSRSGRDRRSWERADSRSRAGRHGDHHRYGSRSRSKSVGRGQDYRGSKYRSNSRSRSRGDRCRRSRDRRRRHSSSTDSPRRSRSKSPVSKRSSGRRRRSRGRSRSRSRRK